MSDPALVSVVIATRNRQRLLEQTLLALGQQTLGRDRIEILVADNGSTDGTAAAVAAAAAVVGAPCIRYLAVATPGKSHAVNRALELARGEVIALTDDDVRPEPQWLEALCTALSDTGADFVAGRILPDWEVPPPAWMSPAMYGVLGIPDNGDERIAIDPQQQRVVPIGANMAVRASVVARIGGLRTDLGKLEGTLRTGEDHEFFLRMLDAGCRGVYEPRARVRHWVPESRMDRGYCRRWLYQNGRDVARLEALQPLPTTRLFGIPRYLWREGLGNAAALIAATVSGDPARRFAAGTRLLWLGGYLREAWFGRGQLRPDNEGLALADSKQAGSAVGV